MECMFAQTRPRFTLSSKRVLGNGVRTQGKNPSTRGQSHDTTSRTASPAHYQAWGPNSSVGSAWARCPQRRGFDPPLGTFSGRGDFSLGVNMGSNSIPPKTLSDESINRGLVSAYMHFIARTQKILTFMS